MQYGFLYHYFIDIDISTDNTVLQYESTSLQSMLEIFTRLQSKNVPLQDPLDLIHVFAKNTDTVALTKYLDNHAKLWHKDFGIDHPRSNELDTLIKTFQGPVFTSHARKINPFYSIIAIVTIIALIMSYFMF